MSFTFRNKQIRKSSGTTDKRLAEAILGKIRAQIVENKYFEIDMAERFTLGEMIMKYETEFTEFKDYKARDKSIFKHLFEFFGRDVTLSEVAEEVGGYEFFRKEQLTNRKAPPKSGTIRKELGLLRSMFNKARKQWRWRISNPVSDISLPADSAQRVRFLSASEFKSFILELKKLREADEEWIESLITVALGSGIREGNLIGLIWPEVDFDLKMINIPGEKMKNDEYLGNPLSETAFQVLQELYEKRPPDCEFVFQCQGKKLYPVKIQRAVRRLCAAAGIEDFRFHDLRHTYASYLRQNGVDLHTIATLLGHKDLRMTKRYAHLCMDSLREPMTKLDNALGKLSEGVPPDTLS